MARVTVRLPRLLSPVADGDRHVIVEADDIDGVVAGLLDRHPGLRAHLFDEAGRLRPHVLCAVDGQPTRLDGPIRPLRDGSRVVFVPSVAGG